MTSPADLPADEPVGALEAVAHFHDAMPIGVTVSRRGRIFVNYPKWGDDVRFTVAELRNGQAVALWALSAHSADATDARLTAAAVIAGRSRPAQP